jgi:hypothetical protein
MIVHQTDLHIVKAMDEIPPTVPEGDIKVHSVSHVAFIDATKACLLKAFAAANNGWSLGAMSYDITPTGDAVLFSCEVVGCDLKLPRASALYVGGVSSKNKRRSSRLYGGLYVRDRSSVTMWKSSPVRENTASPLETSIMEKVQELMNAVKSFPERAAAMRKTPMSRDRYNELLFWAARSKLVMSKRLGFLDKQRSEDENVWTAALKVAHATGKRQLYKNPVSDRLAMLHELYLMLSSLEVPA